MGMVLAENSLLLPCNRVYWQRWYILLVFSLFSMETVAIWNTFGPISVSAKEVFGWTDSTIMQFSLWGCLDFPLFYLPSALLLSYSLRLSVVTATTCMMLGTTIRCLPLLIPALSPSFTAFCHAGAFVNMIAGPIAMAAPIQISASWFPPHERTRATCISQMFNFLGMGVSSLMGNAVRTVEEWGLTVVRGDLEALLYVHAGASILISVLIYSYFPSVPPHPPSQFASMTGRRGFVAEFRDLVTDKNGWLIMLVFSLSQSLLLSWQSSMVIDLTTLHLGQHVTETFASGLGIVISFVSVAVSIGIASVMDKYNKKKKLALYILLSASGIIFILCTLITEGAIVFVDQESFKYVLSILLVLGVSLGSSCAPIAAEFCVDLCYPISEENIGSWLSLWFNIIALMFFVIFQIPEVGTRWMNYVLPTCVLLPLPLLFLVKEQYNRQG